MTITTLADLAGYYNSILEDALFVARERTIMPMLVTNFSATGYAARTIPIWSTTTARDVADGVDFVAGTKFTKSTVATLTPGEVADQLILTDRTVQTDPDGVRNDAALELGRSMAYKVDTDLLGLFDDLSTGKGTANSSLSLSNVAAALAVLTNAKAMGPRSIVMHPYQWHDIWMELGKPSTNVVAPESANAAMREYNVSNQLGASWYVSANIAVDSNDDAYGAVFVREAFALDVREPMELRPERDESLRATELNVHMGYAKGVLRNDHGVYLLSDATAPS